jgi:hypothetical protein
MTLGHSPTQPDVFRSTAAYCEGRVAPGSIYALLHRECFALFPDETFTDLFTDVGRRSVPPMIVAVVMVLQRLEGCSDREAVERFAFDVRWKYAAGGLDFDHPGFSHTVLVDMRARLARSARPERIFEAALEAARGAGLLGRRRVLDSTPLYDAVATMDTVTLLRQGIRGLLRVAGEREDALRSLLRRDDDYASGGKPVCDWDDPVAREALIDALAHDAGALLAALDGETLPTELAQAAALLATLLGQDLETDDEGTFRIARRVAPDRIISTVDPEARHGHKTKARSFDGYKGHIVIDPDSEIVTATAVTPGNGGDAAVAPELLEPDLAADEPDTGEPLTVYADAAYGSGALLEKLETAGASLRIKVQPSVAPTGGFSKDDFIIDTKVATVTCPAGLTVPLRARRSRAAEATFGAACAACPLATRCTTAKAGRSITVGPHEASLARARKARQDPAWLADYRATRPKVERRIAHLVRRRHGGRRARVRGRPKVDADLSLLAAAVNLARLAVLGIFRSGPTWAVRAG